MYATLGDDPEALRSAAQLCSLECLNGPMSFVYQALPSDGLPPWALDPREEFDPTKADCVLRLLGPQAASCSRHPHEVGVFAHGGCLYAVWDGDKDGFGLLAYIGRSGERLRALYATEAAMNACGRLGLTARTATADADETITLVFQDDDPMSQKKITVKIDKTGATTIETSGFQGKACQDATKQLEQALGSKTADTPKQEMYAPPEQTTTVGG